MPVDPNCLETVILMLSCFHNNNSTPSHAHHSSHTSAFKPVAKTVVGSVSPIAHHLESGAKSPDNTSPSPQPSQTNSDPEVDIIGEDVEDSPSGMGKKEENTLNATMSLETSKQHPVVSRKSKNYERNESEVNGSDRKRTKFSPTVNRYEDLNLNFLGHLSEV